MRSKYFNIETQRSIIQYYLIDSYSSKEQNHILDELDDQIIESRLIKAKSLQDEVTKINLLLKNYIYLSKINTLFNKIYVERMSFLKFTPTKNLSFFQFHCQQNVIYAVRN